MSRVVAVDLGATSVRVATVDVAARPLEPVVVHRWRHGPVPAVDGSLRWDWAGIVREVRHGIDLALDAGPVASIGVDGWAVDYGLLDAGGTLLSDPYSYRDHRTERWDAIADRIGRDRLYEITGIQLMPINTIFQLAAHDRGELDRASRLMLLPDLLVHELTGYVGAERSNASTTALLDARTGSWSAELLDTIDVPGDLLPALAAAGHVAGAYREVPVHLVGSHDTASAFLGAPATGATSAFVASGTWVLVGTTLPSPVLSPAARAANFSNELGAFGDVRFLKNVTGLWLIEQCRSAWGGMAVEELVRAADDVSGDVPTFEVLDDRFLSPADMDAEVRAAAGLGADASPAVVTRSILASIARAVAGVVDELQLLTDRRIDDIVVVGGGARIRLLNELFEQYAQLPVRTGSPEATALGNALVQGVAIGHFPDLPTARTALLP